MKIKKVHLEKLTVFILIFLFYAISVYPLIQNYSKTPPNRRYLWTFEYPLDMMGQLAVIREGYLGHWQYTSKISTALSQKPSLVKIEYIIIGQLARIFRTDPWVLLYICRFLVSIGLILSVWLIIKKIFKETAERIAAFSLFLFSTAVVYPWEASKSSIVFEMPLESMVFQRLLLPSFHTLLGSLTGIVSIYFLFQFLDGYKEVKKLIGGLLLGFISSFVYAPTMVLILFSSLSYLVSRIIKFLFQNKNKRIYGELLKEILIFGIYAFIVSLPMLYVRFLSRFWTVNDFGKTELLVPFGVNLFNFIQTIGPVSILSLFAIPVIIKKKDRFQIFLGWWIIILPLFVFLLGEKIGVNKIRFYLGPYFIVFSILTVLGIKSIYSYMGKIINLISYHYFLLITTAVILLASFYTYRYSLWVSTLCFCVEPMRNYAYPSEDELGAYKFLGNNTKEDEVVLSGLGSGVKIPAFSGNKVYISWWLRLMETVGFNEMYGKTNRFYKGEMTENEAKSFLSQNNISYIFFGEDEKIIANGKELQYSFLKKFWSQNNFFIYGYSVQ